MASIVNKVYLRIKSALVGLVNKPSTDKPRLIVKNLHKRFQEYLVNFPFSTGLFSLQAALFLQPAEYQGKEASVSRELVNRKCFVYGRKRT